MQNSSLKNISNNNRLLFCTFELHRGVEQLVARRAHNPKVVGSSPAPATKREYVSNSILFFLSLYPSVFKVLSGAAHPTGNSRALTIAFLIDRVFGIHRRVK